MIGEAIYIRVSDRKLSRPGIKPTIYHSRLVRDSSAVRHFFPRLAGTVGRQRALHTENSRHISTFRGRAARFVLNNYSYEEGSMSEIMETLQWKSLKERRRENQLILFYKGLNGQAKIPT
jgi:hypothetical protein